jgi:hypothetical protein
MDFTSQPKLSRAEWNSAEEPIPDDEQKILKMIIAGYNDVNVKHNHNNSLLNYAKIDKSDLIENFLYAKFFKSKIAEIQSLHNLPTSIAKFSVKEETIKKIKKMDIIRLENMASKIDENMASMMEFVLLDFAKDMLKLHIGGKRQYAFHLYTLVQLRNISVENLNRHVMEFIDLAVAHVNANTQISNIIFNAYDFIEKNSNVFKYGDITLYEHQKRLFSVLKKSRKPTSSSSHHKIGAETSNLILYIAPTGTGKTLSPIGISNEFRVIFVCAARHVGIALAKSAISVHKCIAFAFGCDTAADIRLHYFSALSYKINKRSGGIGKVDNSVGNKVEIMICDVKSYLTAMHYMLAFNKADNIVTYWDEPTIGMDDSGLDNPLHEITHRNWSENKIPNMVLSSATLPKTSELEPAINDFRAKFDNVVVTEINSYDCNKSITLLNKMGYCVCPHLLHENYDKMIQCVEYCSENKTLLRYFDLSEVVRLIDHLNKAGMIKEDYSADLYFDHSIKNVKMNSIKIYYLDLLKQLTEEQWHFVYKCMKETLRRCLPGERHLIHDNIKKSQSVNSSPQITFGDSQPLSRTKSVFVNSNRVPEKSPLDMAKEKSLASGGIMLTTVDAHTLTDGPTIYLAEDVDKIGNFYIQQSNIPKDTFDDIMSKIAHNNAILKSIEKLNAELEDVLGEESKKEKKMSNDELTSPKAKRIEDNISTLKTSIKYMSFDANYIPNTVAHQTIWVSEDQTKLTGNAFVPSIDQDTVKEIMGLEIADGLKVLVLLGIGIFSETSNSFYTEIVKRLAYNKQLFMIIATSDYIYGTNYQFCHGFIGKDLLKMTQQKTIQALGRIGRNNIQQEYSARFRDDDIIANLFCANANNVEAQNMCRLLQTDEDDE